MSTPNPKTQLTEQEIQNLSFDKDFQVIAVEMLGTDGTSAIRVKVDASGNLQVN